MAHLPRDDEGDAVKDVRTFPNQQPLSNTELFEIQRLCRQYRLSPKERKRLSTLMAFMEIER